MNKFIIVSIFLVAYFLGVNLIANFLINTGNGGGEISGGDAEVNLGFSDKVTINVKRVRWYGTIEEGDNLSTLKLFNLAKLPTKVNGTTWKYFHLGVFFLGLFIIYKQYSQQLNKEKRRKWDSNLDGEYSSYSSYPT